MLDVSLFLSVKDLHGTQWKKEKRKEWYRVQSFLCKWNRESSWSNHCLEASVYKWGGTHSGNTELKRLFLLHFVFLQLGLQVDEMYKMGSTSTALSSEYMKVTTLSAWLLRWSMNRVSLGLPVICSGQDWFRYLRIMLIIWLDGLLSDHNQLSFLAEVASSSSAQIWYWRGLIVGPGCKTMKWIPRLKLSMIRIRMPPSPNLILHVGQCICTQVPTPPTWNGNLHISKPTWSWKFRDGDRLCCSREIYQ